MPDIHAGKGCTIGTTMTIIDRAVPNLVGVDIGCGMETTRIREGRLELQKLDKLIYEKIPSGFSIRDKAHRYLNEIDPVSYTHLMLDVSGDLALWYTGEEIVVFAFGSNTKLWRETVKCKKSKDPNFAYYCFGMLSPSVTR